MRVDRKKLEIEMARACLSPGELAMKAGISSDALCKIRRGCTIHPRGKNIGLLAKALNVPVEEIIEKEV